MPKSAPRLLVLLSIIFEISGKSVFLPRQQNLLGNTSILPPGWSRNLDIDCLAWAFLYHHKYYISTFRLNLNIKRDCVIRDTESNLEAQILFGPSFTDPVGLTIESCVAFCNAQGSRLAGLQGYECSELPDTYWTIWNLTPIRRMLKYIQPMDLLWKWPWGMQLCWLCR